VFVYNYYGARRFFSFRVSGRTNPDRKPANRTQHDDRPIKRRKHFSPSGNFYVPLYPVSAPTRLRSFERIADSRRPAGEAQRDYRPTGTRRRVSPVRHARRRQSIDRRRSYGAQRDDENCETWCTCACTATGLTAATTVDDARVRPFPWTGHVAGVPSCVRVTKSLPPIRSFSSNSAMS